MDRLFDRLSSLIRSLVQEESTPHARRPADPDVAAAMDELDAFLKTGRTPEPEPQPRRGPRQEGPRATSTPHADVPEDVVKAYRSFELAPSASMEQVRLAYRKLMRVYHPDKHTGDLEKQRIATEITQRLTESFMKIREYRGKGAV